jgi:prepilin-type N-terminal cleavage/methylation domain-containing protein
VTTLHNRRKHSRNQRGFTLIEIAIVLVISGVLQGQQLIENSRVKSATNDFNGIAAAMLSYRDRYGKFPGDDGPLSALIARGGSWGDVEVGGNGDGILEAKAASTFDTSTETAGEGGINLFQHLRAAGFITGGAASTTLPENPFGGFIGVTSEPILSDGRSGEVSGTATMAGVKICMSNVPGTAVQSLDNELDDGDTQRGRFRAIADVSGTAGRTPPTTPALANAVDENTNYTVCYRVF